MEITDARRLFEATRGDITDDRSENVRADVENLRGEMGGLSEAIAHNLIPMVATLRSSSDCQRTDFVNFSKSTQSELLKLRGDVDELFHLLNGLNLNFSQQISHQRREIALLKGELGRQAALQTADAKRSRFSTAAAPISRTTLRSGRAREGDPHRREDRPIAAVVRCQPPIVRAGDFHLPPRRARRRSSSSTVRRCATGFRRSPSGRPPPIRICYQN
jgi:hypothetical protein